MLTINDIDYNNKKILVRLDLNVPIENGVITNNARILASLPTIQLLQTNAKQIILMSHLGRPDGFDPNYSLKIVADKLSELLNVKVVLKNWDEKLPDNEKIILMENVRFLPGETDNDDALAKKMASLADVFVMDAFGSAHRAHASTLGVAKYIAVSCAGPLLTKEITNLNKIMDNPQRPLLAIVGGAKVSTKVALLEALLQKVDKLIVGGGIANTFLIAKGYNIGKSLYEEQFVPKAKELLEKYKDKFLLPVDVITAKNIDSHVTTKSELDAIDPNLAIFDIGRKTIAMYSQAILDAKTVLWNGPVGVFENPSFAHGTQNIANAVAVSSAYTVAGGGDTIAAIDNCKLHDKVDYISTGGGAFLEYIEKGTLPAIIGLA